MDVNSDLTPESTADLELQQGQAPSAQVVSGPHSAATGDRSRSGRRNRRRELVENPDYAAFVRRVIRAHARGVAVGDIDALPELMDLAADIEAATSEAVTGLREHGFSWADVAARTGTTRQAAHQRWGR